MSINSEDKSPMYKYLKPKCIIVISATDLANENYDKRNTQDITRGQEKILMY